LRFFKKIFFLILGKEFSKRISGLGAIADFGLRLWKIFFYCAQPWWISHIFGIL